MSNRTLTRDDWAHIHAKLVEFDIEVNVAGMVVNNGSFNCNAAKMLVTSKSWPQREEFLRVLHRQRALCVFLAFGQRGLHDLKVQFDQLLDAFERLVREAEQRVEVGFLCSGDLLGGQQRHLRLLMADPSNAGRGLGRSGTVNQAG